MKFALRPVLMVAFTLNILLAVGAIALLARWQGEKSLQTVVKQWQEEKKHHLSSRLTSFLYQAELFNHSQASLLKQNWIASNDLEKLQYFLANQLRAYPSLSYGAWATPQGNYVGIARQDQDTFQVEIAGQKTQWRYETYDLNPNGSRGKLQKTFPFYDPRKRPWYQTAIQKKQATWTPVYLWFDQSQLALDAVLPVYNAQGQLLGVADTPLPLAQISQFLQQTSPIQGSKSFIVERSGDLIASSTPETFLRREGQTVKRLQAQNYGDRHLALASRVLSPKWLGNLQANYPQSFTIRDNHQRFFVYVFTFQHGTAIDWLVYLMVPETAFIQPFQEMNHWIMMATVLILGLGILLSLFLTRWIATPILEIHQASLAIASGNWHRKVKVSSSQELNNLAQAFNQMAEQLKQAFAGLEHEISHDHLTQLPNRNYLNQFMAKLFQEIPTSDHSEWAVIFIDIDDFKLINDSLGHLEGDELLKQASHRLRTCLSPDNLLARFGGDEFVMILKKIKSHSEVIQIVERVINQFRYPFHLENHQVSINISLGITFSSLGYDHPQELLRDASIALFQAKKAGKNGYQIMTPAMQYPAIQRLQMKTELQEALKQQQFCLYFQPLINLYTQQLVGFETLIRWRHPERGLVSPQEFIPLAEETGLIEWIDLWVLNAACQQIEQWQEILDITDPLFLTFNFSPLALKNPEIATKIANILQHYHLPHWRLKLEITESNFVNNLEDERTLYDLQSLGLEFCLDDFGTGYSSLSRLQCLPIQTLKIDRSFIHRLDPQQSDMKHGLAVVKTIIHLAHDLRMTVVAEGIEKAFQVKQLQELGCDYGQGYYFARPLPVQDATKLLYHRFSPKPFIQSSFFCAYPNGR